MAVAVGAFAIQDGFFITGRGLVPAGTLSGQVEAGCYLAISDTIRWHVRGVDFIRVHDQAEVLGLLIDTNIASRDELVAYAIINTTVQVFAP